MRSTFSLWLLLSLILVTGCKVKKAVDPTSSGPTVTGQSAKPGAMLAYSHAVQLEMAPTLIAQRIAALQAACDDEQFGACSVLGIEQRSGNYARSSISLRVVPAGVEPLVNLAAQDGTLSTRQTSAEDLAEAVADVAAEQDLLVREREMLRTYTTRKDLSVTDMLALSQQLARIEAQLHGLRQTSAEQRRRIETNRLDISIASNLSYDDRTDFSLRELGGEFVESLQQGAQDTAGYAGFFLPIVLLVFPLALLWRWALRRATGRAKTTSAP